MKRRHTVYTSIKVWQELEKTTRSLASLQLLEASTFIAEWSPHLRQHLNAEREHGNAEDRFAFTVREHSDTRDVDDVDDRPSLSA